MPYSIGVARMSRANTEEAKMSYYQSRIEKCQKNGREVRELGNEVAVVGGEFLLIGGDAPTAIELSGITDAQALKCAELGRAIDGAEAYESYLAEIGAREVAW